MQPGKPSSVGLTGLPDPKTNAKKFVFFNLWDPNVKKTLFFQSIMVEILRNKWFSSLFPLVRTFSRARSTPPAQGRPAQEGPFARALGKRLGITTSAASLGLLHGGRGHGPTFDDTTGVNGTGVNGGSVFRDLGLQKVESVDSGGFFLLFRLDEK